LADLPRQEVSLASTVEYNGEQLGPTKLHICPIATVSKASEKRDREQLVAAVEKLRQQLRDFWRWCLDDNTDHSW
jgi:hypothetical protein